MKSPRRPSRQVLKPTVSPEHHEVTDSQPSAGLGAFPPEPHTRTHGARMQPGWGPARRWPDQSALVLSGGYVFKCLLDNTLRGPHPLSKWAFLQNPRALLKLGHWLARPRSSLRPQWQLLNLLLVRPRLEGKKRTPLSCRVASGISWSPLRPTISLLP